MDDQSSDSSSSDDSDLDDCSSTSFFDETDDSDWNVKPDSDAAASAEVAASGGETAQSERFKRPVESLKDESSSSGHSADEDKQEEKEEPNIGRDRPGNSVYGRPSARKRARRINNNDDDNGLVTESFRPPEWLTNTKPKRTLYFPQIGDCVVYFRSGHQAFLDKVREKKIYSINSQVKPYKLKGSDSDEICARILDVKFVIKPGSGVRVAVLKMMLLMPEAEQPVTGISFTLKYHHIEEVADFIVLKKYYDESVARGWKARDKFRTIMDNRWWFGLINSRRRDAPRFTYFKCFEITLANGNHKQLSPWDLEPIPKEEIQQKREDGQPVSDEEWSVMNDNGWLSNEPEERERLITGLARIMEYSQSKVFIVPVDLNQHPIYGYIIAYLMDLSTIKDRLVSGFYRRVEALLYDVGFIKSNSEQYNDHKSEIVKWGRMVTALLKRFIQDKNCSDPTTIYQDVVARQDDFQVGQ